MIKSELVQIIAARNPHLFLRDVENIVSAIFEEITDALADGNRVELRGFGAFSVKNRPARTGRNPRTGESVEVEEKWVPFFKTGKELRERLNGRANSGSSLGPAIRLRKVMVNRFLLILVLVPMAIILIALAVANREPVGVHAGPVQSGQPGADASNCRCSFLLFAALAVGMLIGSLATWFKQGRYRKLARQRGQEAQAAARRRHAQRPRGVGAALPKPGA